MPAYTFHSLSDADFEELACDLLTTHLGAAFQGFAKGRDSGIDLLHGARRYGSSIIQCKHYARSTYSSLRSKLAKEELSKLSKLSPSRFILVTSLPLTPNNKEDLLSVLSPYCKGIDDIYGQTDINTLLRAYPKIESAHYKLWLTSTAVLQRILRHGAAVWNAMNKDDIERKMSLYVQTRAFGVAADLLAKHNYCIISGCPGIGKTTLAQVLVTWLMEDGYELVAIRDDVEEAYDLLDLTKRQVVYYDDFLGQSSLSERLGKNEDRGIVRLLAEAQRSKQLKVVFTTREYILEDARRTYEPLMRANLDVAKCIVELEHYTRGRRARILYNHVYFSGLSPEYTKALLVRKGYRKIIDHKGYSPRIVEWMTLGGGPSGVSPADYVEKFVHVLDDPAHVWEHAFDNQLGDDARTILYCLGTVDGCFGFDELRAAWAKLRCKSVSCSIEEKKRFRDAVKQLDGSFVRSNHVNAHTIIEFHNPSIKDYVRRRIAIDKDITHELLTSAIYFEQVACLVRLNPDGRAGASATKLIPDNDDLHEAVRRSIGASSAVYDSFQNRIGGDVKYVRSRADFGGRLSQVAAWAAAYQSPALLSVACDIAADTMNDGDVNITMNVCDFLDAVIRASPKLELHDKIVAPALKKLDNKLSDIPEQGDWSRWIVFVDNNEELFDKEETEEWKSRAAEFCRTETDVILENADTAAEVEQWFGEVQTVARHWNIPIDLCREKVLDRIAELEEREARYDDYEDGSGGFWASNEDVGGSDSDIDHLFGSLGDRAE